MKQLGTKAIDFVKGYWKRGVVLAALSAAGTYAAIEVHKNGIDVGKKVGRCEVVCSLFEANFIAYDDDGCQCEFYDGFIFTIPVDPDYFK